MQAEAIRAFGEGHTIRHNKIGLDATDAMAGVCGHDIYLISSPSDMQVGSNAIVEPRQAAISLNDTIPGMNAGTTTGL
jgi:hypothetical protein